MTAGGAAAPFVALRRSWRAATIALVVLIVSLGAGATNHAHAVIEQIYTLPFWDSALITCPFGWYSQCPGDGPGFHYGTDYQIGTISSGGEAVVAAASGTVKHCQGGGGGNYIVMDHGNGHRTRYLHLQDYAVPNGQYVTRGTLIGYEGNTEVPDGSYHLHFETRHAATTFTCGFDGTAVDPYASETYMWSTDPPSYYAGTDTIGWFRPGDKSWHLNNNLPPSGSNITFQSGSDPSVIPVTGDWDGDGDDTTGWFRPGDKSWHLSNSLPPSGSDYLFQSGDPYSTVIPVTGDWDGDGDDTTGWFRPSDTSWHLSNSLPPSGSDYLFQSGDPYSSVIPVVGDWDGDGDDATGWFRPGDKSWHLNNNLPPSGSNITFQSGSDPSVIPVTGDWNGDGTDTIGVIRGRTWLLRNSNSAGNAEIPGPNGFDYGLATDTPVTGDWDGQ
jgi:murein DD-endopeptidase MepM/ murein hydrolase activator NlpD